jgi:hypothetical protein
VGPEGEKGM